MKKAILLIGLPGSGKSTIASKLAADFTNNGFSTKICSTDAFFIVDGKYQFDPHKLHINHKKNLELFENSCAAGTNVVIVDNTNLIRKNRKPYMQIADKYGYDLQTIVVGEFTADACIIYAERNQHGVTLDKITNMAKSLQLSDVDQPYEVSS